MIIELTRKRQNAITQLMQADHFYATMYGMHKSQDQIIKINTAEINQFVFDWNGKGPAITYLWGWPGPDGNAYLIDDYGETWALTEEELKVTNSENE